MLRKNPWVWGSLIGLLVLLNVWRWLQPSASVSAPRPWTAGQDLELQIALPADADSRSIHRNLFVMNASGPVAARPSWAKPTPVTLWTNQSPTPTPALGQDGSVLEVAGGYRLMGTVSREGKSRALIGKGADVFQVGLGDSLEGEYRVQAVTDSEVYLTENATGNTLKLRIWDKGGDGASWKQ